VVTESKILKSSSSSFDCLSRKYHMCAGDACTCSVSATLVGKTVSEGVKSFSVSIERQSHRPRGQSSSSEKNGLHELE